MTPHKNVHQTGNRSIHQSGPVDDQLVQDQAALVNISLLGPVNTARCVGELLDTKMEVQTLLL